MLYMLLPVHGSLPDGGRRDGGLGWGLSAQRPASRYWRLPGPVHGRLHRVTTDRLASLARARTVTEGPGRNRGRGSPAAVPMAAPPALRAMPLSPAAGTGRGDQAGLPALAPGLAEGALMMSITMGLHAHGHALAPGRKLPACPPGQATGLSVRQGWPGRRGLAPRRYSAGDGLQQQLLEHRALAERACWHGDRATVRLRDRLHDRPGRARTAGCAGCDAVRPGRTAGRSARRSASPDAAAGVGHGQHHAVVLQARADLDAVAAAWCARRRSPAARRAPPRAGRGRRGRWPRPPGQPPAARHVAPPVERVRPPRTRPGPGSGAGKSGSSAEASSSNRVDQPPQPHQLVGDHPGVLGDDRGW